MLCIMYFMFVSMALDCTFMAWSGACLSCLTSFCKSLISVLSRFMRSWSVVYLYARVMRYATMMERMSIAQKGGRRKMGEKRKSSPEFMVASMLIYDPPMNLRSPGLRSIMCCRAMSS